MSTTLTERYKQDLELQVADCDIRLNRGDRELTAVPSLYWNHENCQFIIFKTGSLSYRSQFFYRPHQQYGTGTRDYSDLAECAVSLLQAQADHAAHESGDI